MTPDEFEFWIAFYRAHPFDDYHRFHRPAALVAYSSRSGPSGIDSLLEWLAPQPKPQGLSESDMRTLKTFGIKPKVKE